MTNRMNNWIKQALQKLRELFGGECFFCGFKENLQFAHTKPTELTGASRGRKERYYDVLKHPDCYKLACVLCHRELDTKRRPSSSTLENTLDYRTDAELDPR